MTFIDDVIPKLHRLTGIRRATWLAKAARPTKAELISASGIDRDRAVTDRRMFHGNRLLTRIPLMKSNKFIVSVGGNLPPFTYTTPSAVQAAALI
jgi:hypothetical protein